jgi:hypothetical protein
MRIASASALAGLAVAGWLLRRDGTWDTYRTPLFLPFLSTAVLMAVFSTTDIAGAAEDWRRLVAKVAIIAGVVAAIAALIVSRNPIYDLHTRDVVALGVLQAATVAAAGAAAELGERRQPGSWIRTAWCVAASMAMLALVPRVLLLLH